MIKPCVSTGRPLPRSTEEIMGRKTACACIRHGDVGRPANVVTRVVDVGGGLCYR